MEWLHPAPAPTSGSSYSSPNKLLLAALSSECRTREPGSINKSSLYQGGPGPSVIGFGAGSHAVPIDWKLVRDARARCPADDKAASLGLQARTPQEVAASLCRCRGNWRKTLWNWFWLEGGPSTTSSFFRLLIPKYLTTWTADLLSVKFLLKSQGNSKAHACITVTPDRCPHVTETSGSQMKEAEWPTLLNFRSNTRDCVQKFGKVYAITQCAHRGDLGSSEQALIGMWGNKGIWNKSQPHNLPGPVRNENVGLVQGQDKSAVKGTKVWNTLLLSMASLVTHSVWFIPDVMLLGHGDTCWVSADPQRHQGVAPWLSSREHPAHQLPGVWSHQPCHLPVRPLPARRGEVHLPFLLAGMTPQSIATSMPRPTQYLHGGEWETHSCPVTLLINMAATMACPGTVPVAAEQRQLLGEGQKGKAGWGPGSQEMGGGGWQRSLGRCREGEARWGPGHYEAGCEWVTGNLVPGNIMRRD